MAVAPGAERALGRAVEAAARVAAYAGGVC